MATTRPTHGAPGNRLLARLPAADRQNLLPLLQPVTLTFRQILYQPREQVHYAYFPEGAVTSTLTVMADGSAIEVATVGNEGLVGHTAAMGIRSSPNRVIVQVADGGLRIEAEALRKEMAISTPLRELLLDYHAAFMTQVSQSVACNGLHTIEKRCCRWLLMTRDRVGSDEVPLTHEFLGIMLGVRRASVTLVLRPLQEAGLVRSRRGLITILDGPALEALCCECYRYVKDEYDRLLGDAQRDEG